MRKKLINSGSTKKYLLYAFGEIFLVMIGILLALSVNNWNTQNQNNKRELEYINRLISDISVDEGLLTFTDSLVHAKEKAIQRLMVLYLSEEIINSDTLIYLLNESRKLSFTLPQERQKATFEELLSNGGLGLIRNVELREDISQFYSRWDHSYHRMYVMQSGYGNLILKLMTIEEFFNLDYPSKLSIQGLLKREEKIIEFQEQLMAEANYIIMVKRRISELLGAATLLTQQLRKELN